MRDRKTRELTTLRFMITLYCRQTHGESCCSSCEALWQYAKGQVEACPFLRNSASKPSCRNCRIHCFDEGMRGRIKTVMRLSGPRMLLRHPILSLLHLLKCP